MKIKPFMLFKLSNPNIEYQFFYSSDTSTPMFRRFNRNKKSNNQCEYSCNGEEAIEAARVVIMDVSGFEL